MGSNQTNQWDQMGSDIDGEAAGAGLDILHLKVMVRGCYWTVNNDDGGNSSGHVRVYGYNSSNNSWSQLVPDIDGEAAGDDSGQAVALSGDGTTVAIGARYNDGGPSLNSGHVRVYEYNSTNNSWTQLGSDIDGEAGYDQSGYSVSLSNDGTIVAIGAIRNAGGGTDSGHVRVYEYSSGSWTQIGSDIDGEAAGK